MHFAKNSNGPLSQNCLGLSGQHQHSLAAD